MTLKQLAQIVLVLAGIAGMAAAGGAPSDYHGNSATSSVTK